MGDKTLVDKDCPSGARKCPFSATTPVPLNGSYQVVVTAQTAIDLDGTTATADPQVRRRGAAGQAGARHAHGQRRPQRLPVVVPQHRGRHALLRRLPARPGGATKFFQVGNKITQPTIGRQGLLRRYDHLGLRRRRLRLPGGRRPQGRHGGEREAVGPVGHRRRQRPGPCDHDLEHASPRRPGTPGATTTTAKPAPPAGVDLSKFLSSRAQPITLPSITIPEPPDTGFQGHPALRRPPARRGAGGRGAGGGAALATAAGPPPS